MDLDVLEQANALARPSLSLIRCEGMSDHHESTAAIQEKCSLLEDRDSAKERWSSRTKRSNLCLWLSVTINIVLLGILIIYWALVSRVSTISGSYEEGFDTDLGMLPICSFENIIDMNSKPLFQRAADQAGVRR